MNKAIKYLKWILIILVAYQLVMYLVGRLEIKSTIREKCGIQVSYFFSTLEDDTWYFPGAFDSDYHSDLKIRLSESDFQSISRQIEESRYFNKQGTSNFAEPIYDSLRLHNLKGFWVSDSEGYKFYQSDVNMGESVDIDLNRSTRILTMNLIHY